MLFTTALLKMSEIGKIFCDMNGPDGLHFTTQKMSQIQITIRNQKIFCQIDNHFPLFPQLCLW